MLCSTISLFPIQPGNQWNLIFYIFLLHVWQPFFGWSKPGVVWLNSMAFPCWWMNQVLRYVRTYRRRLGSFVWSSLVSFVGLSVVGFVGWESSTRRAMKVWHPQSGRRRGKHEARDGVELSCSKWAGDWRTFTKLMILHILKSSTSMYKYLRYTFKLGGLSSFEVWLGLVVASLRLR